MLRITYELLASHFLIQGGHIRETVREPPSVRTVGLEWGGRKVKAVCEETKTLELPYPVEFEPDPGDMREESPSLDEHEVLNVVSQSHVDALVSLYSEKRVVQDAFSRVCTTHFLTLRINEGRDYYYTEMGMGNVEKILRVHSLPKKKTGPPAVPLLLSRSVVGNVFHEYTHTLERDLMEREADAVVGTPMFEEVKGLSVYEDPGLRTVGRTSFTDEGRKVRKVPLVEDGSVAGCIDSFFHPYREGLCGYLGYGKGYFPLPRSTNLHIEGKCAPWDEDAYVEVIELDVQLLSLDPFETGIRIEKGEGLYVEEGVPQSRIAFDIPWEGTIQEMVSEIGFVDAETFLPSLGGICVKNGILFRSTQTAPAASWEKHS